MEDKRTAIAIFLCIFAVLIYSELFITPYTRKTQQAALQSQRNAELAAQATAAPQIAGNQTVIAPGAGSPSTATATNLTTNPSFAEVNAAGVTKIKTDRIGLSITTLGARLNHFQLFDYKDHLGADTALDMVANVDGSALPLGVYLGSANDAQVRYSLKQARGDYTLDNGVYNVKPDGKVELDFIGTFPTGAEIRKTISVCSGFNACSPYMFNVDVAIAGASAEGPRLWLEWTHYLPVNTPKDRMHHIRYVLLGTDNKVTSVDSFDHALNDSGSNIWASYSDQYFTATLFPAVTEANTKLGRDKETVMLRVGANADQAKFKLYVGPKDFEVLKTSNLQLERNIDLGIFTFLAYPLLSLIRWFYKFLGNYGLAIILLTLLIKTLFLPLTKASFKSMKAMQDLQPEIKALKDRIKDAQQLNQELLALYKRRGVNPMGGCFPVLIQLPVFLGLYNALLNSIELRHAPFALWVTDLSTSESLRVFGLPIPVMTLLFGASMFLQQWTTPNTATDPTQRKIIMMMPFVFTLMFIIFPFPAGLVLYWLVNNTISIVQQMFLRNARNVSPLIATLIASAGIFGIGFMLVQIG